MDLHVISKATGALTVYSMTDLAKMARRETKGLGKLEGYWVTVRENGHVSLTCQLKKASGWSENFSIAI